MLQLSILFLISFLFSFFLTRIIWRKREVEENSKNFSTVLISVLIAAFSSLKLMTWYSFEPHDFDWIQTSGYLVSNLVVSSLLLFIIYIFLKQAYPRKNKLFSVKLIIFVLILSIGAEVLNINRDCEIQFVGEFNLTCD